MREVKVSGPMARNDSASARSFEELKRSASSANFQGLIPRPTTSQQPAQPAPATSSPPAQPTDKK